MHASVVICATSGYVIQLVLEQSAKQIARFLGPFYRNVRRNVSKNMITKKLISKNQFRILKANSQLLIACLSSASFPLLTELQLPLQSK